MKKPTKVAAGIHYAPIIPRERMYSNATPQQREGVRNLAQSAPINPAPADFNRYTEGQKVKMNTMTPETTEDQTAKAVAPPSPLLGLAGCDCDTDDPHVVEMYHCADCDHHVAVCLGCWLIRRGCDCGTCAEGKPFGEDTE